MACQLRWPHSCKRCVSVASYALSTMFFLLFVATFLSLVIARSQAIHAHFKEWLARTGNLGQINDLLHFDLDAVMTGKTGATSPFSAPPVTPTKLLH